MNTSKQLSKHFRDVYFGGNWTSVNLQSTLSDVGWKQAIKKHDAFNSIAALLYHINYYVRGVAEKLAGGELKIRDKYAFDLPPLSSEGDWQQMLDQAWKDGRRFAELVENLTDAQLEEVFVDEQYGNYYRNILGIIEHTHYHLGQIVILKKMTLL